MLEIFSGVNIGIVFGIILKHFVFLGVGDMFEIEFELHADLIVELIVVKFVFDVPSETTLWNRF